MKKYRQLVKELPSKTVVFAFGRFQPPTIGHELLVNAVKKIAAANSGDHVIYASRSQDKKTNPLPVDRKVYYLKRMFPKTNFVAANDNVRTFIEAIKELNKKYNKLIMVAGSDRVGDYEKLLAKYNGSEFDFKELKVVSAGERDPDSDTASGMSGTKMREAANAGDFNKFKKGLPHTLTEMDGRRLMNEIRKAYGNPIIKEQLNIETSVIREQYVAGEIFLIGEKVQDDKGIYEIMDRGANYVTVADSNGELHKKWLNQITTVESIQEDIPGGYAPQEVSFKGYTTKNLHHSADAAKAFQQTIQRAGASDPVAVLNALKATDTYMKLNDMHLEQGKAPDKAEINKWKAAHEKAKESLDRVGEFLHHEDYWHMHQHELEGMLTNYKETGKEDMNEELSDKTIKTSDKVKVARIIANTLGVENAEQSSSPEQLVNNGLRKIKSKTFTPDSLRIIQKMLELATEAGIKYNPDFVPSKLKSVSEGVFQDDSTDKVSPATSYVEPNKSSKKGYKDFKKGLQVEEVDDKKDTESDKDPEAKVTASPASQIGHTMTRATDTSNIRRQKIKYHLGEEKKEEKKGDFEIAQEHKKKATEALRSGDKMAHHGHMSNYHETMAKWNEEEGRYKSADNHTEQCNKHNNEFAKLAKRGIAEEAEQIEEGKWSDEADKLEGKKRPWSSFANKIGKDREGVKGKTVVHQVTKQLQKMHGSENVQRVKEEVEQIEEAEDKQVEGWKKTFGVSDKKGYVGKSGSQSAQAAVHKAHGKNPKFQAFLKSHGLHSGMSVGKTNVAPKVDAEKKAEREKLSNKAYGATRGTATGGEHGGGEKEPVQHTQASKEDRLKMIAAKFAASKKQKEIKKDYQRKMTGHSPILSRDVSDHHDDYESHGFRHYSEETLQEEHPELKKIRDEYESYEGKGSFNHSPHVYSDDHRVWQRGEDLKQKYRDKKKELGEEVVNEGIIDYKSIAGELVKRHGKNVTKKHIDDLHGEMDTRQSLDHDEVMHHVKKMTEEVEQIEEKYNKTSPAHKAAKETVDGLENHAKAVYHDDGSATVHTHGDQHISSTRVVDHHHDIHGLGYNRSREDYKRFSKTKNGLRHRTKETGPNSHEIHITSTGMKEEVEQIDELSRDTLDSYKRKASDQIVKSVDRRSYNRDLNTADKRMAGIKTANRRIASGSSPLHNKPPVSEEVEQIEESGFPYHMKKAIEAEKRGDTEKKKYHLSNAKTARYGIPSEDLPKHKELLAKYKTMSEEVEIDEHIVKVSGGYQLQSKSTGKNLGTYPTKEGAEKREKQIQYFKHMKEDAEEHESENEDEKFEMSEKEMDDMINNAHDDDFLEVYEDGELVLVDADTGEEIEVEEPVKEEALMEVLSRAERMRAKMRFARTKAKRQRREMIALKTRSSTATLNKRARRMAILMMKKRMAKKPLNKLSVGEKERLERAIARKKPLIGRLAMKLTPRMRKIENARLAHKRAGA